MFISLYIKFRTFRFTLTGSQHLYHKVRQEHKSLLKLPATQLDTVLTNVVEYCTLKYGQTLLSMGYTNCFYFFIDAREAADVREACEVREAWEVRETCEVRETWDVREACEVRETCEEDDAGLDGGFDEGPCLIEDPDFEERPVGVTSKI